MDQTGVDSIELHKISNGNDGATHVQVAAVDCVDGLATRTQNEPETDRLLENASPTNGNGNAVASESDGRDTEAQRAAQSNLKKSAICKVKDELNQKICKIMPLWIVIIFIFVLIIGVVLASLALCAAMYEDPDDKYDPTQFVIYRNFSGSFQLPNLNFTDDLLSLQSSDSHPLAEELEKKLDDLYRDSFALGRYFSKSEIYEFSGGSVTASYRLTFLMPAAEGDQMRQFTLSREMVYNVLKQFLYDQEADVSDRKYIDPASLNLSE